MSWWNRIGIGLLVLAFGASLSNRLFKQDDQVEGKKVVTLAHWQLEAGWRDGFEDLFREYEQLHPDVHIRQIPVSGLYYAQWITTQLLGGMAPDLVQLGREPVEYLPKYYVDMDRYINNPNPYNKGTALEGVAWRKTLIDGMKGGYRPQFLSYYGVPLSATSFRVYYNKEIFRAALGHDRPPANFEEWIEFCKQIEAWGNRQPQKVVPVAAIGTWTTTVLFSIYVSSTTAGLLDVLDVNHNGRTGTGFGVMGSFGEPMETFVAIQEGKLRWDDPHITTSFLMLDEVKQYFQSGFVATSWDDGKFLFIQGVAAMMPTGTWETRSFFTAASFDIGAFPFPIPSAEHPKYGPYIAGRVSEVGLEGGAVFGIPKRSEHPDVAADVLMFLTSRNVNERFANTYTFWSPIVKGAVVDARLAPFVPAGEGVRGGVSFDLGLNTETVAEFGRQLPLWLNNEKTWDEFIREYADYYTAHAPRDIENWIIMPLRRNIAVIERHIDNLHFKRNTGQTWDARARARQTYAMEGQLNTAYELAFSEKLMRDLVGAEPK